LGRQHERDRAGLAGAHPRPHAPALQALTPAQYSASSYHVTKAQAASASLAFNGTGVWFAGARLPPYGAYQLAVDGRVVQTGSAGGGPQFNSTLAGVGGLAPGPHTAILTALDGSGLDVDSVTFEAQIGSASGCVARRRGQDPG
jgi:hypothetical protein